MLPFGRPPFLPISRACSGVHWFAFPGRAMFGRRLRGVPGSFPGVAGNPPSAPSRARLHGSWAASLPAGEPISAGRPRCHFSFAQVLEVLTAHCETSSELYQRIQLPPAAGRERAVEGARGLLRGGQLGPVRRGARGVEHLDRGLLGPGVLPPAVSESGGAR